MNTTRVTHGSGQKQATSGRGPYTLGIAEPIMSGARYAMVTVVQIANFILKLVERIAWLSRRKAIRRRGWVGRVVGREGKRYCGVENCSVFACK